MKMDLIDDLAALSTGVVAFFAFGNTLKAFGFVTAVIVSKTVIDSFMRHKMRVRIYYPEGGAPFTENVSLYQCGSFLKTYPPGSESYFEAKLLLEFSRVDYIPAKLMSDRFRLVREGTTQQGVSYADYERMF